MPVDVIIGSHRLDQNNVTEVPFYALITPTLTLHFGTPEVNVFPMELVRFPCSVAEAIAVCSVWCINLIYRTYASNCMGRRLDRNGSRR